MVSPAEVQRVIQQKRVDEIYTDMLQTYKQGQIIVCAGALIVAELQEIKYLIDGQHRFQALVKLHNDTKHDQQIVVNTIKVNSQDELTNLFNRINNTLPVAEIPLGLSRCDVNATTRHFQDKYPNIFSITRTGDVQRPHINPTKFEEQVIKLLEVYPCNLIEKLESLNDSLKTQNAHQFKIKSSDTLVNIQELLAKATRKGGLYFGLFPKFECFERLYPRQFVKYRQKINKILRNAIWKKYCGSSLESKCPWCDKTISSSDCHMAHDLAHSHGGDSNVDNLYPCCAGCNLAMGTRSYEEMLKILKGK
jgi:hypothetical protein